MKAVKGQVMVLYRHINTEEMVQLFKLGVTEVIDKTLPQELLYRIYMLAKQSRRLQALQSKADNLRICQTTGATAEQSDTLMRYFAKSGGARNLNELAQEAIGYMALFGYEVIIQFRQNKTLNLTSTEFG